MWAAHYIADIVILGAFAWFAWRRNAFQEWGWRDWLIFLSLMAIPAFLAHKAIAIFLTAR